MQPHVASIYMSKGDCDPHFLFHVAFWQWSNKIAKNNLKFQCQYFSFVFHITVWKNWSLAHVCMYTHSIGSSTSARHMNSESTYTDTTLMQLHCNLTEPHYYRQYIETCSIYTNLHTYILKLLLSVADITLTALYKLYMAIWLYFVMHAWNIALHG